ncbi:MAG TPA: pilus assembly protein TadG-related protein [Gaiellaceae bacterium]|nr:pilus assembly protein TadG-related protein [Gaiellaceae bacterium]
MRKGGTAGISDESGQVFALMIVFLIGLLGMCALVIDLGYLYWNQRNLQASADAAALAGAMELPDSGNALLVARQYGTGAAGKNHDSRIANVTETVQTKCLTSIPGCSPVNAVQVDEEATVDTFFMRVFGSRFATVHVRATACSPCGVRPLDIVLVLDRTGSMCQDSLGRADPACTDLNNARAGMKTFLGFLDSKLDWVGLAVLPPAKNVSARCTTPSQLDYNSRTSAYTIVPLSSDYKKADGTLNTSSNLVSTINCVQGGGTTAYANAIEAAQAELDANGRPEAQDVIVFLSDGAANTGPSYYSTSSPYRTQPCHQGVTSAGYSKAKRTIVYSIGYALDDATGGCESYTGSAERPAITVYDALGGIASTPAGFFVKPTPGQLNTIYTDIAKDLAKGTSALTSDTTP